MALRYFSFGLAEKVAGLEWMSKPFSRLCNVTMEKYVLAGKPSLFHQPPRIPTAFWKLGCFVPSLVNLQSKEDERTAAKAVMLQALTNKLL